MKVCVTGGAGYIGGNVAALCLAEGWDVLILDNLSNSSKQKIDKISSLFQKRENQLHFEQIDILDCRRMGELLAEHGVESLVHCAGRKSVRESWVDPLGYWKTNVSGTVSVLEAVSKSSVKSVLFSSSATVYRPCEVPVCESHELMPQNPYGNTKLTCEKLLKDAAPVLGIQALAFRYFNPIGDGVNGKLPDTPLLSPENLFPILMDALFSGEVVTVNGGDYPTRDGSAVRDYLDVVDIARAHILALKTPMVPGFEAVNLGSGNGTTVLEAIGYLSANAKRELRFRIGERRTGDSPISLADSSRAKELWGWIPVNTVEASIHAMVKGRLSQGVTL